MGVLRVFTRDQTCTVGQNGLERRQRQKLAERTSEQGRGEREATAALGRPCVAAAVDSCGLG